MSRVKTTQGENDFLFTWNRTKLFRTSSLAAHQSNHDLVDFSFQDRVLFFFAKDSTTDTKDESASYDFPTDCSHWSNDTDSSTKLRKESKEKVRI